MSSSLLSPARMQGRNDSKEASGVVFFSQAAASSSVNFNEVLVRLVALQNCMDKLQKSQAEQEMLLQNLVESHRPSPATMPAVEQPSLLVTIQQELQDVKSSFAKEVQSSKQELLAFSKEEFSAMKRCTEMLFEASLSQQKSEAKSSNVLDSSGVHQPGFEGGTTSKYEDEDVHVVSEAMGAEGAPLPATRVNAICEVPDTVQTDIVATPGIDEKALKASDENWNRFKSDIIGYGHRHSRLYKNLMHQNHKKQSIWHSLFAHLGLSSWVAAEAPDNALSKAIDHPIVNLVSEVLVVANVFIIGIETDNGIKLALHQPGVHHISWMPTCNLMFNVAFAAHILFKVAALGSWFFISPEDWSWNVFDFVVVSISLYADIMSKVNLGFLRSFRMVRIVRAVRIIRVLRFFRQLRKMLLGILAGMQSLLWIFVFLGMMMFIISVLALQGLSSALIHLEETDSTAEYLEAINGIRPLWGSLGTAMFSLLRAFTGGTEWYALFEPLEITNIGVQVSFVMFFCFFFFGVLNVVTGMFVANIDDIADRELVIQDYCIKTEGFVKMMLELFSELDLNRTGDVDQETFLKALEDDAIQGYIAAYGMTPLQAHLTFDLLDQDRSGKVNLFDFVFGMNTLKGQATAVDAKAIMKEVGMIPLEVASCIAKLKLHASAPSTKV